MSRRKRSVAVRSTARGGVMVAWWRQRGHEASVASDVDRVLAGHPGAGATQRMGYRSSAGIGNRIRSSRGTLSLLSFKKDAGNVLCGRNDNFRVRPSYKDAERTTCIIAALRTNAITAKTEKDFAIKPENEIALFSSTLADETPKSSMLGDR
jgi:hypothetical protein